MKIKSLKRSTNHKKLLIIACVILLLVAIPLTYVYAFNGNLFGWKKPTIQNTSINKGSTNYGPATPEQQKAGTSAKSGSTTDTTPSPAPIPGSDKKSVQVTITAANQNGSVLQIRALIGAVENTGTCTLVLSRAGQSSVTKTAGTQALSSTSTCQGFDVPTTELSTGAWQALITYDSPTLTGSATKSITVQ
jgi:hypothetical protein